MYHQTIFPQENFKEKSSKAREVWETLHIIYPIQIHNVHLHIKGFKKFYRKENCLKCSIENSSTFFVFETVHLSNRY